MLLELGGARLLTDPVLRPRLAHLRRHGTAPRADAAARLDAVLLSHLHRDHFDRPSLRRLDPDVAVIAPRGAARALRRLGLGHVIEVRAGERVELGGASVTAVPAEHDGRRHPLAPATDALGFVVAADRRVYFAGDTDVFDDMSALAVDLDVALLPVWGWGPSLGPGHMDPLAAARATALLRPRVAVPIHWGTFFPLGLERLRGARLVEPPREFANHVTRLAPDVEVRILAPGEGLEV